MKDGYQYLFQKGYRNISLFGTSIGAVAIMKTIRDYNLDPHAIIIECPFGTMYKTVKARFKMQGLPSFPMAGLLVFWAVFKMVFGHFRINLKNMLHIFHVLYFLCMAQKTTV